jgi:hypothetical protein
MSRVIDPEDVKPEDRQYLLDRPWMVDEFRRRGFTEQMDAVEEGVKMRPSPVEASKTTTEDMRIGTQAPQQIDPRSNGVTGDGDEDDDVDYNEWSVADLKAEIDERNKEENREEKLSTSGNKADLVKRLEEDDLAEASA